MSRSEIRKALKAKRGAMAQLARDLSVTPFSVSVVLGGNLGNRVGAAKQKLILDAARALARKLSRAKVEPGAAA